VIQYTFWEKRAELQYFWSGAEQKYDTFWEMRHKTSVEKRVKCIRERFFSIGGFCQEIGPQYILCYVNGLLFGGSIIFQ
jgi:hypothetical protein